MNTDTYTVRVSLKLVFLFLQNKEIKLKMRKFLTQGILFFILATSPGNCVQAWFRSVLSVYLMA